MDGAKSNYDFLGSVYIGTNHSELEETLDSIISQTKPPKNVFIVIDGEISNQVNDVLIKYQKKMPLKLIHSKKNLGLGLALRKGLKKCKSKIVLRFDTDDINFKNRAYLQIKELLNSKTDIVGSEIYEFINDSKKFISKKKVPIEHNQIGRQMLFRNPINHPTVAFLKDSIIKLDGGYRNCPLYEDYDLWIRAFNRGLKFKNIAKPLVAMRIKGQRSRRRGLNMILKESRIIYTFFQASFIKGVLFIPIFIVRSLIMCLPINFFDLFYKLFLRDTKID